MTTVVRTPDERFDDLPDWPWQPVHVDVEVDGLDLRLARVDEGPADAHPVVLLHGEPTWGYLWRHVVPPLLDAGHRVVVPDLPGFGRSDKPQSRDWYTFDRLLDALDQHLDAAVGATPVTLVVHDWGGLLGLPWATANRDRIARLVLLDTGLYRRGARMSDAWWRFRDHVAGLDAFPVADMVDGACRTDLTDEVRAAYEAPFPDPSSHGGPLALPLLVPIDDDSPGADAHEAAWAVLEAWEDPPVLLVWGEHDPIIPPGVARAIAARIPAAGEPETVDGSHFLQEDAGPAIGARVARFVAETSAAHDRDRDEEGDGGPVVVDAMGRACPLPVIDLAAAVGSHPVGTVFELLADDPAARVDVPVWCRMQRQRLDDVQVHDDRTVFTVTKVRDAD